jgi:hypothetical protein
LGSIVLLSVLFSNTLYYKYGYCQALEFRCRKSTLQSQKIFLLLRHNEAWLRLVAMVTTKNAKATYSVVLIPMLFLRRKWWERSSLGFEHKHVATKLTIFLGLSLQEERLVSSFSFDDALSVTNRVGQTEFHVCV